MRKESTMSDITRDMFDRLYVLAYAAGVVSAGLTHTANNRGDVEKVRKLARELADTAAQIEAVLTPVDMGPVAHLTPKDQALQLLHYMNGDTRNTYETVKNDGLNYLDGNLSILEKNLKRLQSVAEKHKGA